MAPALLKPRKFGGSFAGWQSFALPATRQPVNTSTETQSSLSVKLRRYWISVFWSSLEMPWNAITSKSKGNEKLSRQEAPNSVGGVKGECIIMLMMMLLLMMMIRRWWCARWGGGRRRRGRKVMMLRRMMLRRKTDPKTGKHTLCEPAQSKCTWTCHQRHVARKLTGKMPYAYPAASILCEPAESKCTWTCHKRHFVRKFTGKMPDASDTTSIEHRALTVTVRTPQCGHTVWGTKRT